MKLRYFRLGFDWIRFNFDIDFESPVFDSFFRSFSETGRQWHGVWFFEREFTVTFKETQSKQFLYFQYGPDEVFCLEKVLEGGFLKSVSYAFTFYGSYFYIDDLNDVLLAFVHRYHRHLTVSRIDIALDVNLPVRNFWHRKTTRFQKRAPIYNGKALESFYLGDQSYKNKKHLIRVYDKRLDSGKKGRFHLFLGYLKEETVTRIEAELHTKTIKDMKITPQAIFEYEENRKKDFADCENILEVWFRSLCINEEGTCFHSLRKIDFKSDRKIAVAKFTGRAKEIEELPYARTMLGYAKRLHEVGFDVRDYIDEFLPPFGIGSNSVDCLEDYE